MKRLGTMLILLGLASATGCSALPFGLGDAVDTSSQRAADVRDTVDVDTDGVDTEYAATVELTDRDKNILNNVKTVMEECPLDVTPYEEDVNPRSMRQAVNQCEMGHTRVQGQLSRIDAEKQSHPKVAEADANVVALGEKIEEWQQEIADVEAAQVEDRETYQAYQAFLDRPQERILRIMYRVSQNDEFHSYTADHVIGELVEAALTLEGKAEECEEKFDNDRDFHRYEEDSYRHPTNTCYTISNWREYLSQYLNLHATDKAQSTSDEVGRMIDVIEEDGYTTDGNRARLADLEADKERIVEFYEPLFESVDRELNETFTETIATIAEQQSRYDEVLRVAVQEQRWDGSSLHNQSDVRQALNQVFNGTSHTIRGSGVVNADWTIEYAPSGAPVSRYHRGAVLTQHSGENFCRLYSYRAVAQYDGTGYTQPTVGMNLNREVYFLSACP